MASEYRVTTSANGTFAVELWQTGERGSKCLYKADGFQTREQAETWIVPVQSKDPYPVIASRPRDRGQSVMSMADVVWFLSIFPTLNYSVSSAIYVDFALRGLFRRRS